MIIKTPIPMASIPTEEPPNLGGTAGAWLLAAWKAGFEAMLLLCAGAFLGCALCITAGDKFTKLGIVDYRLVLLCIGIACVLFFLALAFRIRFIKRAGDKWASADAKEEAFRQARADVEKERFSLSNWFAQKQEDEAIESSDIDAVNLKIKKEKQNNALRLSLKIVNRTGGTIQIYGLTFGWAKTPKSIDPSDCLPLAYLTVDAGVRTIQAGASSEYSECFELVRSFEYGLPEESIVRFDFTRNGISRKTWRNQVSPVERDL